jgi:hypothetical protein
MLTRRRLLVVGGATAAALATGSALLMRGGGDAHYRSLLRPGARPVTLTEKELAVLTVLCDAVVPELDPSRPGAGTLRVAERIDKELSFHHAALQADFAQALFFIEHGGVLRGSTTRFTRLTPGEREARLEAMAVGSDLERQVFNGLRFVALFYAYCDERAWPSIHYAGPPFPRTAPEADSRV